MPTPKEMYNALQHVKTEDGFIDYINHLMSLCNNKTKQKHLHHYQEEWARKTFRGFTRCKNADFSSFYVAFPRGQWRTYAPYHFLSHTEQETPKTQCHRLRSSRRVDEFQFDPFVQGQRLFIINHPLYKSEMVGETSDDCRFRSNSYRLLSTALKCVRMQFSGVFLWTFAPANAEYVKSIYQQLLERTSLLKITEDSFAGSARWYRNIWKMKKDAIMK